MISGAMNSGCARERRRGASERADVRVRERRGEGRGHSASDRSDERRRGRAQARRVEAGELDRTVVRIKQYILRPEVAVDDAMCVQVTEGNAQLLDGTTRVRRRHRTAVDGMRGKRVDGSLAVGRGRQLQVNVEVEGLVTRGARGKVYACLA